MRTSEKIQMDWQQQRELTSGETEGLEQLQDEWISLYNDKNDLSISSNRWDYESVMENPEPFLQEVAKLKVVPRYKYVLNYLLVKMKLGIGRENLKRLYDYLENEDFPVPEELTREEEREFYERMQFERADDVPVMDTETLRVLWKILSKRTNELFVQNGYKKRGPWEKYFCKMITDFDFQKLTDMAWGLKMPLMDFNIFLNKVLKRSALNVYNRDEVLIYITIKYCNEQGCNSYFDAYKQLEKLYPEMTEYNSKMNEDESEIICDIDDEDTASLRKELDSILNKQDTLIDEAIPELEEYFKTVGYLNKKLKQKKRARFSEKRFRELWDNIYDEIQGELGRYEESIQEEKQESDTEKEDDNKTERTITVEYPAGKDVFLRKGLTLYCDTKVASVEGEKRTSFYLTEDVTLPAKTWCEQVVDVKAISPQSKLEDLKKTKWAKDSKFASKYVTEKCDVQGTFYICANDEKLRGSIRQIQKGENLVFVAPDMKKTPGKLILTCEFGTCIPKGTLFAFDLEGVTFEYETMEAVTCSQFAETDIVVEWTDYEKYAPLAKEKKDIYVIPANIKLQCDVSEIHNAYFKKPVKIMRQTVDDSQSKDNSKSDKRKKNDSLEMQFLYSVNANHVTNLEYYNGFPKYGDSFFLNTKLFKETRITNNTLSSWVTDEERQRNYILTLLFLLYVIQDMGDSADYEVSTEQVLADFDYMVSGEMNDLDLQPLSMSNPYDAFLMLLLTCDSPLGLFQSIWSDKDELNKGII